MKRFLLYGHGGAYNHGAEAIVKCTAGLLNKLYPGSKIILSTHFKEQDLEFGMPVDEYCERSPDSEPIYKSTLDRIDKNTVCFSVGGDNYCYENWRKWKAIHETALERGAMSILWSCSVEPSMLCDEMIDVLRSHDLITARESLTYNALKAIGLDNVVPCSEIAFLLEPQECRLPESFIVGNTAAINISPLIVRRELSEGIILKNAINLINSIIEKTDMNVALIPHVLMPMDNDLSLLQDIYHQVGCRERVCLIDDNLSAASYKYIISKCRFGVFARTHASIAAYSSCVPSIAIGYSSKSKGIAEDLGLGEYVLPLEDFEDEFSLLKKFECLIVNEIEVKGFLSERIPSYKEKAAVDPLGSLLPYSVFA